MRFFPSGHSVFTAPSRRPKSNIRGVVSAAFRPDSMPSQEGKAFLVTGGNAGLGFETCKALAARRAKVFMASRSEEKQQRAVDEIKDAVPNADISWLQCDLGKLRSVLECSKELQQRLPASMQLNLISNAGVIDPPDDRSPEGFEVTLAINYWGAFYLTHLLLSRINQQAFSRIVFVNSISECHGQVDWEDLQGFKPQHSDYTNYARSKAYLTMFARELQHRLRDEGSTIDVMQAHPGISSTDIFRKEDKHKPTAVLLDLLGNRFLARWQPPERAAHAVLYAATDPTLTGKGGASRHYGPTYLGLPIAPLALTLNLNNIDWCEPQNRYVKDAGACQRLYEESLKIINETAPQSISPVQHLVSGSDASATASPKFAGQGVPW